MGLILQNLIVIAISIGCGVFALHQGWKTLAGKKSRLGSCCAKGCSDSTNLKKIENRVVFLPLSSVGYKKLSKTK